MTPGEIISKLNLMNLKRDNWTTKEVIEMIKGLMLVDGNGNPPMTEYSKAYNQAVEGVAGYFETHFACPADDFSALSYDVDTGQIFHTGTMPPR